MKPFAQRRQYHPTTRRQRYLLLSSATTLLVVMALVLVNIITVYLTDRYPVVLDLTPQKIFELSDQSKEYLNRLEEPVSIQVLNNEESFRSGGEYFVQAQEVLSQYARCSDKVTLEYIDLLANPSLAAQYEDVQIGDIIVSSGKRTRTLSAYDLFQIESGSYGSYITASKAEQVVTSAILNVTSSEQVQAAILTGHGEQYPDGLVKRMEQNNFEVRSVSPAQEQIPQEVQVLLWVAPLNDPDQTVLDQLDSFLQEQEGRTLLYFADTTQPELPRLEEFLEKWGIRVQLSSVIETDNRRIINMNPYFSTTQIEESELTDTMTDTSIPLTLPFARPLETVFETNLERNTTVLLRSSDSSAAIPYGLTEEELKNWTAEEYQSFPLAILSRKSFADGQTSQVAVYGSSVSLSDSLLDSGSFSNADYYLSVLNTLTQRENVISIQSKTIGGQELGLNTAQVFTIGFLFIAVVPIVTLACGCCLWLKRRNA